MLNRHRINLLIYSLALLIAMTVVFGLELYRVIYRPIPISQKETLILRVEKSTTAQALLRTMHAQGWIGSVRFWTYLIRFQGWSGKLRSGIYQVQPDESVQHLLLRIVAGDILRQSFMIRPGATLNQITKDLQLAPYLEQVSAQDWNQLDSTHPLAEGLVLPDTYVYDAGSSAQMLLNRAHIQLEKILKEAWQNRNPVLPYQHPYELLIAASILEKEAALPQERRLISGVIINRLKRHMPLQMDPTVIYALGETYTGKLTHEQMGIDSPYNTYRYKGLPPTPIATASKDAIDAASHPEVSPYLYFVARGDGTHEFHSSYAKHLQAIQHYMRKP